MFTLSSSILPGFKCLVYASICNAGGDSCRGKIQHYPSSSLSDSSSPSSAHFTGHYPATRSGRGRRRNANTRLDNDVASSPHPNQSAQFHFRSTLDCPCIIATISVAFMEELPNSEDLAHIAKEKQVSAQETNIVGKHGSMGTIHGKTQDAVLKRKAPDNNDDQDKGRSEALRRTQVGNLKNQKDNHVGKQDVEDDRDAYRCRIVEEPPSPPYDT